jgi:succinyl-CoA synthetase alpha subunit
MKTTAQQTIYKLLTESHDVIVLFSEEVPMMDAIQWLATKREDVSIMIADNVFHIWQD